MRSRQLVLAVVLGFLAASCAAPRISSETKAVFERSRRVVVPERSRIPWKVGQWVLLRISTAWNESFFRLFRRPLTPYGFRRIGITGREGGAYWLEVHEDVGRRDLRLALLIDGFDPRHMDRLRVIRIRRLDSDGRITEIGPEGAETGDEDRLVDDLMAGLRFIGHEGRLRTITVPAGTFESTNAVPISFSTTFGMSSGYIMYTNAVPVVYYAKRVTTRTSAIWAHETQAVELVDFGLTGARSSFLH